MAECTQRVGASGNLAAFTRLYGLEMTAIRQFAETLPLDEAGWYRALCARCDTEFTSWESKRYLDGYRETAGRIRIRAFGVLAHAYLHVGYDFPRFLADSFADCPGLSRERRYRAYVLGSQHVRETILTTSKQPSIVGVCGALMRLLPGDRPAARLAASWFLAHRCAAWAAAEALAASDNRAEMEERLWRGIDRAGRALLGRSPLRWIKELPFSSDLVLRQPSN